MLSRSDKPEGSNRDRPERSHRDRHHRDRDRSRSRERLPSGPKDDSDRHKHHSHRHHKHHRHHHHHESSKDEGSDDEAATGAAGKPASSLTAQTQPAAASTSSSRPTQITAEDFHKYSTQYRLWLDKRKRLKLFDISKEQAHKLFLDFVSEWNAGRLDAQLYRDGGDAGLQHAADGLARTAHAWGVKLDDSERLRLESLRDDVVTDTFAKKTGR